MNVLVGYTGFVGTNLSHSYKFDKLYNSKNIEEAFGTNPDLLVYSGVRAEMFLANKFPEQDRAIIDNAIKNIIKINPKFVVLISTISVYDQWVEIDETNDIKTERLLPYGVNRLYLEQWVEQNFSNHLILRLPALYGLNIKKNFIYDLIQFIPAMLNNKKYVELSAIDSIISAYYKLQDNGFYKCKEINSDEKRILQEHFSMLGFSALNFTDSRAVFQFYNLSYLWTHIQIAMENNIKLLNLVTEPIAVAELYNFVTNTDFRNEVTDSYPIQDIKTIHSSIYGGESGYIFTKYFVMKDIKKFVESAKL